MKCLIDMDGVLVDFVKGICELRGRENPYEKESSRGIFDMDKLWGISVKEMFDGAEHDFWANLEWTEDGKEILSTLIDEFGIKNCCILSSPSRNLGCMSGKLAWINREIPEFSRRFLFGTQKHFVSHSNSILFDDKRKNCIGFRKEGGTAIMIRRPWNSIDKFNTLKSFKEELAEFKNARSF